MAFRRQFILFLSALFLGGQIFAATREERAYAVAVGDFQTQLWDRAAAGFEQFRKNYPDSTNAPLALLLEAQAQFEQGNFHNAAVLLENPNNFARAGNLADQYADWLGEAQFAGGDFAAAAETFGALAQNFTNSTLRLPAVVNEAAALAKLQRWEGVEKILAETNGVFQSAARLDAGNELISRGRLFLVQANFERQNFLGAARVLDPLAAQPLPPELDWQRERWIFRLDAVSNDWESALADATDLIQIARLQKNAELAAEGVSLRAETLEKLGRTNEASAAYADNLTGAPAPWQRQAILKIAALAVAQNHFGDAEKALGKFLAQFPDAAAAEIALLSLGELHLKEFAASPAATNHLIAAQNAFGQFLDSFTNSPLLGKVFLDRGWANWLAGNFPESLADFESAAEKLPPSADLAVAKFKLADAQFAEKDFTDARDNYQSVLDDFANFPEVKPELGPLALYQILRASLELNDAAAANAAEQQILAAPADAEIAQGSALLLGENTVDPAAARAVLENFQAKFSDSKLRPQAALAIARTFEREQNWDAAITNYAAWLVDFPTNQLRAQAAYSLAWANFQAGDETNALAKFSSFTAQFPADELAPQAQWWVADYFFRATNFTDAGNFKVAETNYENIFQNTNAAWRASPLVYPAQLMAGRAAIGRLGFSDAVSYFTKLIGDTNCPPEFKVQAQFLCGAAYMEMASPDTNNPLANFQAATNVFAQIITANPTNESGARAWGEIGDCDLQLGDFVSATNAYAQVFFSTNSPADISARSAAQIGFGLALEKMAATLNGTNQTALLNQALDNYLDVFETVFGKNLRDGETADSFWVMKAGWQALPLLQSLKAAPPGNFIDEMEKLFPQLQLSLEKLRALPPAKS